MQTELDLSNYVKAVNYEITLRKESTNNQRNLVRSIILNHPEGVTDLEICVLSGLSRSSVNARRNEIKGVIPVGIAKICNGFDDRLNIMWGFENGL